jgi:DNA-binding NtrC family response regulator
MENLMISVLCIDDEPLFLEVMREALSSSEVEVLTADDPILGLEIAATRRPQTVFVDLLMPKMGGMQALERLLAQDPGVEVILLSGQYSTEFAVEAIQNGASDYLTKPIPIEKLRARVERTLVLARERRRAAKAEEDLLEAYQFNGIIGRSPAMLELFARVRRIAPHFRTVLVQGPTGSGKELIARALHRDSPAASGPFVVCNCAAITETLFESEVFGYNKGAFTGALHNKIGLAESANGGVLFLDEIGELPLSMQAKILRLLQNQEVQRVGSTAPTLVDVRVVAATNRDLRQMMREGRFREDLFYRLSVVEIVAPSLCERPEDLRLLQQHFLDRFSSQFGKNISGITRRAQKILAAYPWPGNVRELEGMIANACMMTSESVLDVNDFPANLHELPLNRDDDFATLEQVEHRHVQRVLARVNGSKVRASEILGISRATLYATLERIAKSASNPIQPPSLK